MRKKKVQILLLATFILLSGCGQAGADAVGGKVGKKEEQAWDVSMVYEAEDGVLLGGVVTVEDEESSYVDCFIEDGDGVEVTVTIPKTGFYDINVFSKSLDTGSKDNYLLVDGTMVGTLTVAGTTFTDSVLKRIYMEEGEHTITVEKYWGWIQIDKFMMRESEELDESRFDVEPILVNENANESTRRLMTYLCDVYGTDILSGQYCDTGMYGQENAIIWTVTEGKYPAILGLDMMDYTPSRVEIGNHSTAVELAVNCWYEGGIVTFCWHWSAPTKYLTGKWYTGFNTDSTNLDLAKVMNGEDMEAYELLMEDVDAIATQLKRLQDAGVPILWRPLHEASGGWFWWGASGPEAYKELYKLLYDKLTYEYGLNNLIWVWNGEGKEWYPGDEYVDIISLDIYAGEKVYTAQTSAYLEALEYTDAKKMIVLSENGCLFDPDLAIRDGAMWGYFGTWNGEFVTKSKSLNILSEQYTEEQMWKKVYQHEHVITRDELPDLIHYPLREE